MVGRWFDRISKEASQFPQADHQNLADVPHAITPLYELPITVSYRIDKPAAEWNL
jgi:hypothetical protein